MNIRCFPPHIRNNRGSLLIWAALILIIITATISATIWIWGSKAKTEKIKKTIGSLDAAVNAVISYGVTNKVLPNNTTFPTLLRDTKDPWGNDFIYLYDSDLTNTATGGLCGKTTTSIRDTVSGLYMAFLVTSKGPDSSMGVAPPNTSGSYSFVGSLSDEIQTPSSFNTNNDNLYRTLPLEVLKSKAGCSSGRLTILNNQLPDGCATKTYSASVFASGGISSTGQYSWCIETSSGSLPAGITATSGIPVVASGGCATATWGTTLSAQLDAITAITATAGTYPITFFVKGDDNNNKIQKTLSINIKASCGGSSGPIKDPIGAQGFISNLSSTPAGSGVSATATTVTLGNSSGTAPGCIWSDNNPTFLGKTMRAYYAFKFSGSDTGDSSTYGDGFTYTLMTSANSTSVCGDLGTHLGYDTGSTPAANPIGANSLSVEFDTRYSSSKSDPSSNHIAAVGGASNAHSGSNASCALGSTFPLAIPSEGCYYTSAATWLEDASTHIARIEIRNDYNDSTCTTFTPNSTSRYALLRAWVDCNDCNDLTSDYTQTPLIKRCFALPGSLDNVKFGFTHAAEGNKATISNFGSGFYTQPTGHVKTWAETSSINVSSTSQPRRLHTSVAYNNYLYVIGGYDASTTSRDTVYYAPINSNGTIGTWLATNPIDVGGSKPRDAHATVVNKGYMYVIGGNRAAPVNTVYYAPINSDGSIGTWKETTSIKDNSSTSQPLYHLASVVNNGYLYVIGGNSTVLGGGVTSSDKVFYAPINSDGSIGTWKETTSIKDDLLASKPRWLHTSVVNNGYMYVIGGSDNAGNPLNTVYYSPINADGSIGTWKETTSIKDNSSTTQNRYLHTSAVNNGYMYVIGGWSPRRDTVYYAPINTDGSIGTWKETTSIKDNSSTSQLREHHTSVVNNGYLYVIGGQSDGGIKDTVYYVPFAVPNPTCTISGTPVPAAGGTSTFSYTTNNGPVAISWSPATGAPSSGTACANATSVNDGSYSCNGAVTPGTYTLNLTNSTGDTGSCSAAIATSVNGTCGTDNGSSFTSTPTNLCSAGTPTSVTPNTSTYTWQCTGSNGGTTASCSATRQYTVTTSRVGTGGTIGASQTVNYNGTASITVTPNATFTATMSGTCGGSPANGTAAFTYTTSAITANCTVIATFLPANCSGTRISIWNTQPGNTYYRLGTGACAPNPITANTELITNGQDLKLYSTSPRCDSDTPSCSYTDAGLKGLDTDGNNCIGLTVVNASSCTIIDR
ncbi:MAG: hypothetical protein HQL10_02540 [Nitrospirae bacterium]|nr:hypothetical protein [Nitrospirota bacterium]